MNGNWSDYQINRFHRQEKMREAEMYRLSEIAEGKGASPANRIASILASLLALVG